MSLTLEAPLQTAQDGQLHHPIVELTSYNPIESIPFDGYKISGLSTETEPKLIMHSSERLVYVYIYNGKPYMGYSDLARTIWHNGNALEVDAFNTCTAIDLCEMADGNIGIITVCNVSGTQSVQSMVYTQTAAKVSGLHLAFTWTTNVIDYNITLNFDGTTYRWIMGALNSVPDPDQYYFRTGTSTDMVTWNAATTFVPSGLDAAYPFSDPYWIYPINDSPILIFAYTEAYSAEGKPLTNLYYIKSTDGGATWEAPIKLTNYSTFNTIAYQPALSQVDEGTMLLTYTEETPTLYISIYADGWSPIGVGADVQTVAIFYDHARQKFYVQDHSNYSAAHALGITEVDIDTWSATDYWDTTSVPAIPGGSQIYYLNKDSGVYNGIIAFCQSTNYVIILNPEENTVKYWLLHDSSLGERNVNWTYNYFQIINYGYDIRSIHLSPDGWVYLTFSAGNINGSRFKLCRLHIEDAGPTYTLEDELYVCVNEGASLVRLCYEVSLFVYGFGSTKFDLLLITDDGGTITLQKSYLLSEPTYLLPTANIIDVWTDNTNVYLAFTGYIGLYKFNLSSESATRIIPPFSGVAEFKFLDYDSTLNALMCTGSSGLYVYYLASDEWVQYNPTSIPGITPSNNGSFVHAFYDAEHDGFVVGKYSQLIGAADDNGGALFIPRDGKIQQINYAPLTKGVTDWELGAENLLIKDFTAVNATTAYVPNSSEFYALWSDFNNSDSSYELSWDKTETSAGITQHLVDGTEVAIGRNITGEANELTFSLADGALFDDWYLASMLRKYTLKGRKITVRFGERINGIDYFVNQGSYYVSAKTLNYVKGEPRVMKVTCTDALEFAKNIELPATTYYSNIIGSTVFKDIAVVHGAVGSLADIDSTPFIGDESMNAQFIDQTLYDILYTLAWRYGCMPRFDMNNKLDCIEILNETISHTYDDNSAVLTLTPDDSYSDLTNKVTILGEDPTLIEVIHTEEMVAQISGSVGWWGEPETYTIWYSEDREKRVLSPRLKVISSAEAIAFRLAGGVKESITYIDPENKYCKVKVDAPNLIPALAAAIAGYFSATWIADGVVSVFGGKTIPIGRKIEGIFIFAALNILGSIATFQYEIWGNPVGELTRTIQGSASDTENIAYIGKVFEKTMDGWNCDSVPDCQTVAARELAVAMAQRRRIKIEKKTHLQDEEGDTIKVRHPISNQFITISIVELNRKFIKGEEGSLLDTIEGWVLV
jgi:hypothetical protein